MENEEILYENDMEIWSFMNSKYLWLCDDYPCPIEIKGIVYRSVRHAVISLKTQDIEIKKSIAQALPADLKTIERSIPTPLGWGKVSVLEYLYKFTKIKFETNPDLALKLAATNPKDLRNEIPEGSPLARREIDEVCNSFDYCGVLKRVRIEQ